MGGCVNQSSNVLDTYKGMVETTPKSFKNYIRDFMGKHLTTQDVTLHVMLHPSLVGHDPLEGFSS